MSDPLEIAAELLERRFPIVPSVDERSVSPEVDRRLNAEVERLLDELEELRGTRLSDAELEALARGEGELL